MARFSAIILFCIVFFISQETIKQLREEVSCIEEAQNVFSIFSDWLSTAQKNFSSVAVCVNALDRLAMEKKMKKLEVVSLTCVLLADPSRPFTVFNLFAALLKMSAKLYC